MSMNFEKDLTENQQEMIKELLDEYIDVMDERKVLLNTRQIQMRTMSEIARKTNQVVELELNDESDIKTMSDGTKYIVTGKGWKKIEDSEG